MDSQTLKMGLTALARAGILGNCYLGHFGCGMLASSFVCEEARFPEDAREDMEDCRKALITEETASLFLPDEPEQEKAIPDLIDEFKRHITTHIGDLSRSGHVSIVGMYALRGFLAEPDLITPSRVNGIMRLIDAYMKERPEPRYYGRPGEYQSIDTSMIPRYDNATEAFEVAISESREMYPDAEVEGTYYYFAGEKLHGLTHGHAIYELERIGEKNLAKTAYPAHRLQMLLDRMVPPRDIGIIEGTSTFTPEDRDFWRVIPRLKHQLGVPHAIKRGYSLLCARRLGVKALDDDFFHRISYILQGW
jgi:hypothetical protein